MSETATYASTDEMIFIPKQEYEQLQEASQRIKIIEKVIHQGKQWDTLLALSEEVAKELWDNDYDDAWNGI